MEVLDPKKARETMRSRIDAAMEALSRLLKSGTTDRGSAVETLREVYRERALQPIRGKAWPQDIWDKEMATLYVIAKYALALDEENRKLFDSVFGYEETLEEVARALREKPPEEARKLALFLLGGQLDDNTTARILRLAATKVALGFADEDEIVGLLRTLPKVFPEQERTVRNYARYYIALRVAQAIAAGAVRSRIDKEALKQAYAATIGLDKVMPDDNYIAFIAANVFEVPRRRMERLLGSKNRKRGRRGSAAGS